MTVATYNPAQQIPVSFTPAAIKHLSKQVANAGAQGIEFKIKQSGCSGYKYLLELCAEKSDSSLSYRVGDDLDLFIEPTNLRFLQGTKVDYRQEGVNFKLSFENPNAAAHCGCGESFSIDPQ